VIPTARRGARWCLLGVALAAASVAASARPAAADELDELIAARGVDPSAILRPMALDAEMRAWLAGRVPEGRPEERLRRLLEVLVDPEGFGLGYASDRTRTAREVFDDRKANCLSFTHIFVALARELGLDAYYVEARRSPRFEQEGDLVVVWEHVTAAFGPPGNRLVLEFDQAPSAEPTASRRLSDLTAVAIHYSNHGAELLRAGEREAAREWLDTAVTLDPQWSPAWLNLGVVRRRSGDLAGAESAYRRAIEADPSSLQPYFNLAALVRASGDRDAARDLLVVLDRQNSRDPFIPLALGDESLAEGRLEEARRFLRRSVRLAPHAAEPSAALGLLALARGERRQAERALERAGRRSDPGPRYNRLSAALGHVEGPPPVE